jgi:predicted transcriptional regulator
MVPVARRRSRRVRHLPVTVGSRQVRLALLLDGERFAGVIAPDDLPSSASGSEGAEAYARRDIPTVGPDDAVDDALAVIDSRGERRLVVLDDAGSHLLGLLCLDKSGSSFCLGEKR